MSTKSGGKMMINGAHVVVFSQDAEADKAFLRDVVELPNVDVGDGWLIFGLPPAEMAIHPADKNSVHEFYFMCEDIEKFVAAVAEQGISCSEAKDEGWGVVVNLKLPGGGELGVYQPRHARPDSM